MKAKLGLILVLLNTVALLGTLGVMVYTKLIFTPPKITEDQERKRLEELKAKPVVVHEKGLVPFEALMVNIAPETDGTLHYVNVEFTFEIRDRSKQPDIEAAKQFLSDSVVSILGRKSREELTNVQGRYNLKGAILEAGNQLLIRKGVGSEVEPPLTNLFFSSFIIQ